MHVHEDFCPIVEDDNSQVGEPQVEKESDLYRMDLQKTHNNLCNKILRDQCDGMARMSGHYNVP